MVSIRRVLTVSLTALCHLKVYELVKRVSRKSVWAYLLANETDSTLVLYTDKRVKRCATMASAS